MKRKSLLISIVVLLTAGIVSAFIFVKQTIASNWQFVRTVTGFEFPAGTDYIAQIDNGETFVVSVVRLPDISVSTFIKKHGFLTGKPPSIFAVSYLPKELSVIPIHSDIRSAHGQTDYQDWRAILDPRTKLLWIQIIYPDWSGDHPGTAPQPNHRERTK